MTPNDFENQLDEIRIELYEKTKSMKKEDAVATINDNGRIIAERYEIDVINVAPVLPVASK